MVRAKELSDFQRGTIVGCHISKKTVRQISALLDLPRSTVSAVIVRWKRQGATTVLPRSGRPHKLSEQDRRVLKRIARKNRLSSVAKLTTELQTASGSNVSTRTVRRELNDMGFRGRAAIHKHKITVRSCVKPATFSGHNKECPDLKNVPAVPVPKPPIQLQEQKCIPAEVSLPSVT